MEIQLAKFGAILTSRQNGREAVLAFASTLGAIPENETVAVDFSGIVSVSPSWAGEFLVSLHGRFGDRLRLHPSDNPSVAATMDILEQAHGIKFRWVGTDTGKGS